MSGPGATGMGIRGGPVRNNKSPDSNIRGAEEQPRNRKEHPGKTTGPCSWTPGAGSSGNCVPRPP